MRGEKLFTYSGAAVRIFLLMSAIHERFSKGGKIEIHKNLILFND